MEAENWLGNSRNWRRLGKFFQDLEDPVQGIALGCAERKFIRGGETGGAGWAVVGA